MTVTEVLQLMENLLYKHEGKEFDDLHKEIITGLLQYKTYREIAEEMNYDPDYVGKISRELYNILSKELKNLGQEAEVKKGNFALTIERLINSDNNIFLHESIINSYVSLCSNSPQNSPQDINNNQDFVSKCYHDLTFAPKILKFYNRETELNTLNNWIFNQNINLISVLGLSGIGKTYLVKRFVDLNLDQVEVIVWKNLKLTSSLNQIIKEILAKVEIFETSEVLENSEICQFLNLLKKKKCLIILDHVANIFMSGQFAGQYQQEYKDYQNFFRRIIETEHQSNIILISQEECTEMRCFNEDLSVINCLKLSGLNDVDFMKNLGLKDEDSYSTLIKLYEGNPFYLKSIAHSIENIYGGNIAEFLAENSSTGILPVTNDHCNTGFLPVTNDHCNTGFLPVTNDHCNTNILPVITTEIKTNLESLFNKLSEIEQKIIVELSNFDQFRSRAELKGSLDYLSSTDFINGLESLQQRYLITKIKEDKIMFKLSPLFREYVKNNLNK